jgi:predicted permease
MAIMARLAPLHLDPATEADVVEEIWQHLEDALAEAQARGEDADAVAREFVEALDVGALDHVMQARRAAGALHASPPIGSASPARNFIDTLRRDVVYGWRSLWRSRGATIAIVLSLAIVIGANTVIFGLVDAMFLRRVPLPHAEQLATVTPVSNGRAVSVHYWQYQRLQALANMPPMAAFRFEGVEVVTPSGEHADMWIDLVTGGYFQLLGVKPALGRAISTEDEHLAAPVAVISDEFWTRYLDRRSDVLGKTLALDDVTVTIVGVMPPSFTGLQFARHFQIALPFSLSPSGFPDVSIASATIVARLTGSENREARAAALDAAFHVCCVDDADIRASGLGSARSAGMMRHVMIDDPPTAEHTARYEDTGPGLRVILNDASRGLTWSVNFRDRYRDVLLATMAAVLLLLLIACANVATLLLARGEARDREFAIRRSLGASAARIRFQLLVEGLELAAMGSLLGFALAAAGTRLLLHALPMSAAPLGSFIAWRSNAAVIGFTAAIMIVCAIATTLWPALRAGREALLGSLTGARRYASRGLRADRVLVVAQVTLAIVLTSAAALYVSTVRNLTVGERGYHSRDVLFARLDALELSGDPAALQTAYDEVLRRARDIPGVEAAALTFNAPVLQDGLTVSEVTMPGSRDDGKISVRENIVSAGSFAASGIGLVSGRDFAPGDGQRAPPVAIVSQSFERKHYGRSSALGRTILIGYGSQPQTARIIGVAHDAGYDRLAGLGTDLRTMVSDILYQPLSQVSRTPPVMTLILRTAGDPLDAAPFVRRLSDALPSIRFIRIAGVGQLLDDAASRERFAAALATGFGVLALVLTAVGVFGVLWFHVSLRTKEIGLRMALGAQRADAVRLVLRQCVAMTAIAVVLGVPLAIGAAWVIRAQLYGVRPTDPKSQIGAVALLTAVGIAASIVPARRAAAVDPLTALRDE